MNVCPECETQLTDSAKFCYSCGYKLPEKNSNIDQDLSFFKKNVRANVH
jgi:uncharacterized membrane protein YvbJ